MEQSKPKNASSTLEENLKKAVTELLILRLLSEHDYYIGELAATLKEKSGGVLNIVFPYSAIYRLQKAGYIFEKEKRNGPDGRRRQYFQITESGRSYLKQSISIYTAFSGGVDAVLKNGDMEHR